MMTRSLGGKLLVGLLVTLCLGGVCFFFVVPAAIEKRLNGVSGNADKEISDAARKLHSELRIADLHADSLLWDRDLNKRASRGHVDMPRLIEGNVALQVFSIVSKVPSGMNVESTDGDRADQITLLAIAQRWSPVTWRSLHERALHQSRKLHEAAARSEGRLIIIKTASDLAAYLHRRERELGIVGGLLAIEGAHALEGKLTNLDVLFDHGVRIIAPTHFFDNEISGSAHGIRKGGLTPLGREMIRRMEEKGITLDLAHASAETIDDALAISTKPVVVSHTGVRGTCANNRNLSDEQIIGIAGKGGIIGIGYWETAVCGADAKSIARAVRYTASLVGVEHVALGSDFDGAVTVPFDASKLVALTDALLDERFTPEEIKLIMGENVIRLLSRNLPG